MVVVKSAQKRLIITINMIKTINLIGLIESKKGTIRANHFHPQQEQKCLFTKGQIIEIFQDIFKLPGKTNLNFPLQIREFSKFNSASA